MANRKVHRQVLKYPRLTRTAMCGETYATCTTNIKDVTCKRCLKLFDRNLTSAPEGK